MSEAIEVHRKRVRLQNRLARLNRYSVAEAASESSNGLSRNSERSKLSNSELSANAREEPCKVSVRQVRRNSRRKVNGWQRHNSSVDP